MTSARQNDLKVSFIVTDVVSFNLLCGGQLEAFSNKYGFECSYICGGKASGIEILMGRDVGRVYPVQLVRKPSVIRDLVATFEVVKVLAAVRPDIVVYSTPKAMVLGAIASFLCRVPVRVALVRGRVYENYKGLQRSIFALMDRVSLLISNHCLFISKSLMAAYLAEGIVAPSKARVLGPGSSNGIDMQRFNSAMSANRRQEFRRSLGCMESDFLVVSIGRVCLDKGSRETASVIRMLSGKENIKFLWVGDIEDQDSEAVVNSLAGLGSFTYRRSVSDVSGYFSTGDLHLFLSHREGFGNVALEAAALGIPTVAFDVVGVRDSVSDGVSGKLFALGELEGVARYIEQCAEDRDAYRQSYAGARTWAASFSQEAVWDGFAEFYKLVSRPR